MFGALSGRDGFGLISLRITMKYVLSAAWVKGVLSRSPHKNVCVTSGTGDTLIRPDRGARAYLRSNVRCSGDSNNGKQPENYSFK